MTRPGAEAAMGWISTLEHDCSHTAGHFCQAVSLLPASEQTRRRAYCEAQADAYSRHDQDRGGRTHHDRVYRAAHSRHRELPMALRIESLLKEIVCVVSKAPGLADAWELS